LIGPQLAEQVRRAAPGSDSMRTPGPAERRRLPSAPSVRRTHAVLPALHRDLVLDGPREPAHARVESACPRSDEDVAEEDWRSTRPPTAAARGRDLPLLGRDRPLPAALAAEQLRPIRSPTRSTLLNTRGSRSRSAGRAQASTASTACNPPRRQGCEASTTWSRRSAASVSLERRERADEVVGAAAGIRPCPRSTIRPSGSFHCRVRVSSVAKSWSATSS
jgi:hypothetical protein